VACPRILRGILFIRTDMVKHLIIFLALLNASLSQPPELLTPISHDLIVSSAAVQPKQKDVLASHVLDLTKRDKNEFVNQVFKHNILLTVSQIPGQAWKSQDRPGLFSFVLQPGEVFAFHKNILGEYREKEVKAVSSEFKSSEGYRSSGWIVGDGVCHLASLMNWTASEAGLKVKAVVNHNFRSIPGIPRQYGTSVRYSQSGHNSQNQNLYIENNLNYPVEFRFEVQGNNLRLEIIRKSDPKS